MDVVKTAVLCFKRISFHLVDLVADERFSDDLSRVRGFRAAGKIAAEARLLW